MGNYNFQWAQIVEESSDRYINLLLIKIDDDPDPYVVGSVIRSSTDGFLWVVKNGPSNSSPTEKEAMNACEACLVEFYLNKGLMPWATAFVSSN